MQLHVSSGGRLSVHEVPFCQGTLLSLPVWLKCYFWLAAFGAVCIAARYMCHGLVHHRACH